jgi:DNA-directed RNA polymerase specialized sigma24 family protein
VFLNIRPGTERWEYFRLIWEGWEGTEACEKLGLNENTVRGWRTEALRRAEEQLGREVTMVVVLRILFAPQTLERMEEEGAMAR